MKIYLNIFWQFFILGLFSFGGPIAHIGYFRKRFVENLKWLDDEEFSKIVALSQFLPGPSSSQVGFSIGLKKGGVFGAIIAFIAFTFPSFLLLYLAAVFQSFYSENVLIEGLIGGLKLFAVVIVADATYSMFNSLCKTKISRIIFILSATILVITQSFYAQILVILFAGVISLFFVKKDEEIKKYDYKKPYFSYLFLFLFFLIILPFLSKNSELSILFNSFYQVGSLVFGGGHVVLPLISSNVIVDENSFLIAYSLAQAVPGPMFTIASYIGAISFENSALLGSIVATVAIFLPGFLLILAFHRSFESYSNNPIISKIILGVNASVVAILFSVLCLTVIPNGIVSIYDLLFALFGFFILKKYNLSILVVILMFCLYGMAVK
jgi:chromate transporter